MMMMMMMMMMTPHLRTPQSRRLLQNEGLENPESRQRNHGINPKKDTFHPRTPNRSTFNQTTTGSCATSTRGSEVKDRLETHDARTPCVELIKWPPGNPKATPRLIRAPLTSHEPKPRKARTLDISTHQSLPSNPRLVRPCPTHAPPMPRHAPPMPRPCPAHNL